MSFTLKDFYAGGLNTIRGRPASFDISSDGRYLLYGCGTNILIKDLKNPLKVDICTHHKYSVTCARFSPHGYNVCSADKTGQVIVWSVDNEDKTIQLNMRAMSGSIVDICWTSDNKRIAIVGNGKKTFAHVFLWDTGSPVGRISGHSGMILSVSIKPQRPYRIATGSEDYSSNFYRGPPFKFVLSNRSHSNYVNCVRFSPSGKEYVSVSSDKSMRFYDGKDGNELGKFESSHKSSIYKCAWSKQGDQLLTSSADKTVKLWDFKSKKCIKTFTFEDKSVDYMQVCVKWSHVSGQAWSASLNGAFNLLDFNNPGKPKTINGHNSMIEKITYDGKKYLYSAGGDGQLIQWEIGTENNKMIQGKKGYHKKNISSLIVVGNYVAVGSEDSTLRFVPIDKFTYQKKNSDIKLKGVPCDIQLDGKGNTIVVATHNSISIVDASSQSLSNNIAMDFEPICIAVNKVNDDVAVGGDDKLVRIYSLVKGSLKLKKTIKGHRGIISALRYSPDGKLLAVGDKFREIIVYETSGYSIKYEGLMFHTGAITDLDWTKDSKYLLSSSLDKYIIVWDLDKKKHIKVLAHLQGVRSCAVLDKNTVISAGASYNIKSWTWTFVEKDEKKLNIF